MQFAMFEETERVEGWATERAAGAGVFTIHRFAPPGADRVARGCSGDGRVGGECITWDQMYGTFCTKLT